MSDLRYGSLFSGYAGLDTGVQSVLGGSTAWFCEFDKAPSAILAHHWPDVPNLGDITQVQWVPTCGAYEFEGCGRPAEVLPDRSGWQCNHCRKLWPISLGKAYWPEVPEPVDVLTGGFPCQDVSHAGRRAGLIRDGEGRTRSGLWGHMLRAVDQLRPRLVVAENVRGLLSAAADSDVEPCPWCLGDANGEPDMRALGAILADLADVGYDAWWVGLRAADVGAPHGRFRVFIFATPRDATGDDLWHDGIAGSRGPGRDERSAGEPDRLPGPLTLLPTPDAYSSTRGGSQHPDKRIAGGHQPTIADDGEHLLPTPRATDGTKGGPNQRGSSGDLMLPSAVQLLPTPDANMGNGGRQRSAAAIASGKHQVNLNDLPRLAWGDYGPAIARWESVLGCPAPEPTEPGPKGNPRLSPRFVEWMMGLPAGHVTDPAIGLTRNEQLKALGNGVVPAQAAAATHWWLAQVEAVAA